MKQGYYSDGKTKYTDPFWTINCTDEKCNYKSWSLIHITKCPKCGANVDCFKNSVV